MVCDLDTQIGGFKTRNVGRTITSSEELLINSDHSSSAGDLEEFPYSSGENANLDNRCSSKIEENEDSLNSDDIPGNVKCVTLNTPESPNSENLLKCLFCDNHTNVGSSRDVFLTHLRQMHKFIIGDSHLIADFKKYIEYWRGKFASKPLIQFCSIIRTSNFPEDHGVQTTYLLLSDLVAQDRKLREVLQQTRLKLVLEQNQLERTDTNFSNGCIFCEARFVGNRSDVFEHMHGEHCFNVGHPDNLVFVSEMLDVLRAAVHRNQCLFCDDFFPDRDQMLEHMKRKQHRKLNAKNTAYDKYYVINYLELGRSWEDIMADEDNEIWRELKREEYNWSDWREDCSQFFVCLFCHDQHEDSEKFKAHLAAQHNFMFDDIVHSYDYTFYDQVKIFNFIRARVSQLSCHYCRFAGDSHEGLTQHFETSGHDGRLPLSGCWNDDSFLVPAFENDAVFTILKDVEDNLSVCEVDCVEKERVTPTHESILNCGLEYIDEDKLVSYGVTVVDENGCPSPVQRRPGVPNNRGDGLFSSSPDCFNPSHSRASLHTPATKTDSSLSKSEQVDISTSTEVEDDEVAMRGEDSRSELLVFDRLSKQCVVSEHPSPELLLSGPASQEEPVQTFVACTAK